MLWKSKLVSRSERNLCKEKWVQIIPTKKVLWLQQYDRVAFPPPPNACLWLEHRQLIDASRGIFAQLQLVSLMACFGPRCSRDMLWSLRTGLFYIGLSLNSKWKLQLIQNLELGKFAIVEFLGLQVTNTIQMCWLGLFLNHGTRLYPELPCLSKKALWRILCPPAPIRDWCNSDKMTSPFTKTHCLISFTLEI